MERKKLLIVTGEVSGDLHGYNIAKELLNHQNFEIHAVGGNKLRSLPIKIITDLTSYSTIGFTDFIPYLGKILKARRKILDTVYENRYDAILFIDNQGFNIPVARKCKKAGIKCYYYFPPIVSVWDRKNSKIIPGIFDLILCPFKADAEIYLKNGGKAVFTGHAFIDTVKANKQALEIKKQLEIDKNKKVIGIFPGSRKKEIQNLLPDILQACTKLKENTSFILSCAYPSLSEWINNILLKYNLEVKITNGTDYDIINACDIIVGASGSLAIETALLEKPMVVLYKVSKITYFLAKLLIKTKYISWPNIILDRQVYPELIQNKVNPENIYNKINGLLNGNTNTLNSGLKEFKSKLGNTGVIKKIAKIIIKEISNE